MSTQLLNKHVLKYILLPLILCLLLVYLYLTPKEVFGCVNRGLAALTIAFSGMCASCVQIVFLFRSPQMADNFWRIIGGLLYLSPVILLLGPLR